MARSSDPTWTFEDRDPGLELEARRLRLDVVRLAHALHETGHSSNDDDIRATARKILAFVDGDTADITT